VVAPPVPRYLSCASSEPSAQSDAAGWIAAFALGIASIRTTIRPIDRASAALSTGYFECLHRAGGPCRGEQARLSMKFTALELPDRGQQARARHRRHRGRAQAPCCDRIESQVGGHERRRGHRSQIVQAADRQPCAHQPWRQVGGVAFPARAQHHRREMAAGRMPAGDDAAGIELVA
jgi:hypothetical protein